MATADFNSEKGWFSVLVALIGAGWRVIKTSILALIAFAKGSVMVISTVAAAVAALETREIATNIYDNETRRLMYDKNKYTADILYKHLDSVSTSGVTSRCIRALLDLDHDDFNLMFNDIGSFNFQPDKPKHAHLVECLPDAIKDKNRFPDQLSTDEETKLRAAWMSDLKYDASNYVAKYIDDYEVVLVAYYSGAANKKTICENLSSITDPEAIKGDVNHKWFMLLQKLKETKLMRSTKNVKKFIGELEQKRSCDQITAEPQPSPPRIATLNRLIAWCVSVLPQWLTSRLPDMFARADRTAQ